MTKWRSEWLDWKPSCEGFEGSRPGESSIIQILEGSETRSAHSPKRRITEKVDSTVPSKPTKPTAEKIPPMPPGVTLIAWNPKHPPVGISYCAVVNDVEGFIADTLTQLGKLLDSKAEPETTSELRDLVDALEQCGVIVQIRGVGSGRRGRKATPQRSSFFLTFSRLDVP